MGTSISRGAGREASVVTMVCLASLLGCSDAIERMRARNDAGATPPPITAAPAPASTGPAALEKSFAALDFNPDGKELQRCGCASADQDHNGEVTKAEYLAAGLLGKLPAQPAAGAAPVPVAKPNAAAAPAPVAKPAAPPVAPPAAPPVAAAGGLTLGTYNCYGLVGRSYVGRGSFTIVDGSHYAIGGSAPYTYVFDPGTKKIKFTSGLYADPDAVTEAWQVSAKQISKTSGKGGFYQHDCTIGG